MTEAIAGCTQYPGPLQIEPWHTDGETNAFFLRHRVLPPSQMIPDGRPRHFHHGGIGYYNVAGVDEQGPFVVVCLDRIPVPFPVGLTYRPTHRLHTWVLRCADCVRRWCADPRNQI